MLVAWLLVLAGGAVSLLYGVIVWFTGCHGSDVSEAPPEGSAADALCGWPLALAYVALGLAATAGPLVSTRKGASRDRLALGFVVTSGAVLGMALVGTVIERGGWNAFLFVNLPAAIFVLALVLAAVARRRPQA